MTFKLASEGETLALAGRLGARARPGSILCLSGPLGSGKTTFVRGFLRGAGFRGRVQSPTFALVHEYRDSRPRIYHLDLYRVVAAEVANLGLEEYLRDAKAVCLIEWPEAARRLLSGDRIEAEFFHEGSGRVLKLRAVGPRSRGLLRALS